MGDNGEPIAGAQEAAPSPGAEPASTALITHLGGAGWPDYAYLEGWVPVEVTDAPLDGILTVR